jgi:hypothetical protein
MENTWFCLWLTPVDVSETKLSLLIDCLAAKHNTPSFRPHVTLAIATGERVRLLSISQSPLVELLIVHFCVKKFHAYVEERVSSQL